MFDEHLLEQRQQQSEERTAMTSLPPPPPPPQPLTPPPPPHREAEVVKEVMADIKEEFLHCEICYEDKARSCLFACCHSFCAACTDRLPTRAVSEKRVKVMLVQCPVCRQWTKESALKADFRDDKLRDFHARLVAAAGGEAAKWRRCDLCTRKTAVSAKRYANVCLACNVFLCDACLPNHAKTCRTKAVAINSAALLERLICARHSANIKTLYCETCETTLCTVCAYNDDNAVHSSHTLLKHADKLDKTRRTIDAKFHQYRCKRERVSERKAEIVQVGRSGSSISQCALQMLDEVDARERAFRVTRDRLLESAVCSPDLAATCDRQLSDMALELDMCDAALCGVSNQHSGHDEDTTADHHSQPPPAKKPRTQ